MICFWKIKKLEEKCCVLKIKLDRSNVFDRWSVMNRTVGIDDWIDEPTDLSRFRVNQMVQKPPISFPHFQLGLSRRDPYAAPSMRLLPQPGPSPSFFCCQPTPPIYLILYPLLFILFFIFYFFHFMILKTSAFK